MLYRRDFGLRRIKIVHHAVLVPASKRQSNRHDDSFSSQDVRNHKDEKTKLQRTLSAQKTQRNSSSPHAPDNMRIVFSVVVLEAGVESFGPRTSVVVLA